MAEEPIGTATYDNINALRGDLARAQERYQQWRIGQQRDLHNREMMLERLKAEIDQRVQTAAMAMANTAAQMELQVEQYAQAISRALTATENPHTYGGPPNIGQNTPNAPTTPAPLRLPGG